MAIKLADTLAPMGDFPAVESDNVEVTINGMPEDLQTAIDNGDIGGGSTIQVDTLPIPSADELGKTYQYIGTTGNYKNSYFYRCDAFSYLGWEDGSSNVVYTKDLENAIGGKVYSESGGIYTEIGTITELADDDSTMTYDDGNGNMVNCTRNNSYDVSDAGYTWTEIVYGSNLQEGDGIDITNDTISVVNRLVVTDTMPTASASLLDATRLYVGTTTSDFSKGGIYQCQSDGEGGYEWILISQADVDLSQYKKIFTGTSAEWDELTLDEKKEHDECDLSDDIASGFPIIDDAVIEGSKNAVTSGAVFDACKWVEHTPPSGSIGTGTNISAITVTKHVTCGKLVLLVLSLTITSTGNFEVNNLSLSDYIDTSIAQWGNWTSYQGSIETGSFFNLGPTNERLYIYGSKQVSQSSLAWFVLGMKN